MSDPRFLRGGPEGGYPLGTLGEIGALLGGRRLAGDPGLPVIGVAADTRAVRPGDLFCALRGARVDAHRLLDAAFAAGAVAALVDRPPGSAWCLSDVPAGRGLLLVPAVVPALGRLAVAHLGGLSPGPWVVAVTGSVGKTTTRGLIGSALAAGGSEVLAPDESFNTEVTVPLVCLRAGLQHRFAVLELAMRGSGQIAYLAEVCRPRVGVLTVIGESHLEVLGSVEAIAAAKGELLRALPADGFAVLNADDPRQGPLAAWTAAPVRTYGFAPDADCSASDARLLPDARGWAFTARFRESGRALPVRVPLLGRHHVQAALAALCCAELLGVDLPSAAAALEGFQAPAGRLSLIPAGPLRILDDTFNAAPRSTLAALETLTGLGAPGSRAAVLGDMLELGPVALTNHRMVGRAAAGAGLRWLLTVGPLAREIAAAAREAGMPAERVREAADVAEAEAALPALLERVPEASVVLFKASHSMGLEHLAAAAVAWGEAHGARSGADPPRRGPSGPPPHPGRGTVPPAHRR